MATHFLSDAGIHSFREIFIIIFFNSAGSYVRRELRQNTLRAPANTRMVFPTILVKRLSSWSLKKREICYDAWVEPPVSPYIIFSSRLM
jgi:hypothetical protein